jgi:uncharacterized protein (TIGR03067 family)
MPPFLAFLLCSILVGNSGVHCQAAPGEGAQTTWKVVSAKLNGKEMEFGGIEQLVVISGKKVSIFVANKLQMEFQLKTDDGAKPKAVDLIDSEGYAWRGIYEKKGESLKVCLIWGYRRQPDQLRPRTFETEEKLTIFYMLKKVDN